MSGSFPFPEVNASLNGAAFVLLTLGFICVKNHKISAHRLCMLTAFAVSVVFLGSYLTYHWQVGGGTPFGGTGLWRPVYFAMLISHIFLAIALVPLVIRTFSFALSGRIAQHRRWARWTFPIWYYVSVTGVLVYFFLYQFFPSTSL